jgi:hypothetical protein
MDTERLEFGSEGLRETFDRELARVVQAIAGKPDKASDRRKLMM